MRATVRSVGICAGLGVLVARLAMGCAAGNDAPGSAAAVGGGGPGAGTGGGTATAATGGGAGAATTAAGMGGGGSGSVSSTSAETGSSSAGGGSASSGGGMGSASSSATSTASASSSSASSGGGMEPDAGPDALDGGCALFSAEAQLAPAAMLTVLDKSASMNNNQKWGTSQIAVVSAIDKDVFDTMSLGLVTFPTSFVNPPACLCSFYGLDQATCNFLLSPGVSCGYSALPQVAITPAGMNKSNAASGVRHDIYQYLVNNSPLSNQDDGSPIYDALQGAYAALKAYAIDKRILVLITDGGFSCTSLASPARPGYSDGACNDWEYPDSVNALITAARTDPTKPVLTFVVGVPGSNSTGADVGGFATPPYAMRLALSTYAVSGSPATVDPACDAAAVFAPNAPAPAVPCHIDLSNGAQFNADALADAIASVRKTALGCVYDLPAPPDPNQVIDPDKVNVDVTIGGVTTTIPKRTDPNEVCLVDPCWDYNGQGQVEILGKGCADLSDAADAKVDILVGCDTIHQ